MLRKTPYNQKDKIKSNENESTYQFKANNATKECNTEIESKVIKENEKSSEICAFKDDQIDHNLIISASKTEDGIILPEQIETVFESVENNNKNDYLYQTLHNNYLEAEIEPGLLLSGHLVEI